MLVYLTILKIFNVHFSNSSMAGIFDAIPAIAVALFVIGIVGIMVYEKSKSKAVEESNK